MSDNGAINDHGNAIASQDTSYNWDVYRHYQNSFTVDGVWYKLKDGKSSAYEGGHRKSWN